MMCFGLKDRKRVKTNHCVIVLLDDTQLVHELHSSSTGQDLLDVVIKHLNLLETSYFGLRYLDNSGSQQAGEQNGAGAKFEQIWLDVNRSAIKQLKDVHPMTVYFGVKYYSSDPCKLAEEITRYQFFLQCKQDIFHSRLPIPFDLAIELFALAVQSELGDYDPQRHQEGYVSEFQFLPNQTVDMEKRVALYHKNLTGQVPATAEMNFLERVKWLDLYGCELHPIQYEETSGEEYALGLNPSGVLVLRNRLKFAHYLWPRIIKTKCQGRCFLMDVIDSHNNNNGGKQANNGSSAQRNRFGFRLADKAASQRLRWAIEEHKSFYHLIHNSATLNQLAQRQQQQAHQQQMKLSQRFRQSIRSAISVGQLAGPAAAANAGLQQQFAHQQKLRSSMSSKSLSNQQAAIIQQQQYAPDSRAPPTVVRMPSRRYSNRSMTRGPYVVLRQQQANVAASASASAGQAGVASTMVDSQRQQALMMMSQFNQMGTMAGKSQTLKPMPVSVGGHNSKEAKRNPYYQMMMMMAAEGHQQQMPEVAILPPGRHIVQPSIYKASSVVNGINQLGGNRQQQQQQQMIMTTLPANQRQQAQQAAAGPMAMQFFNSRSQCPASYNTGTGYESPRSTKSAIAPSNALRLASRKLVKQQQQLLYNSQQQRQQQQDVQPLLAYDSHQQQQHAYGYYRDGPYTLVGGTTSANVSPRSVRSARLASRHKSKSTNENLHLLHNSGLSQSKMLLTTANMMPPPPGYHNDTNSRLAKQRHHQQHRLYSDNESDMSKLSKRNATMNSKKRATFALDNDQANLLLNSNGLEIDSAGIRNSDKQQSILVSEEDDDYCCSRSDCSSIDGGSKENNNSGYKQRGNQQNVANNQRTRKISSSGQQDQSVNGQQQSNRRMQVPNSNEQQQQSDWNAIRRRHNEFSNGKGYLAANNGVGLTNYSNSNQRQQVPYLDANGDEEDGCIGGGRMNGRPAPIYHRDELDNDGKVTNGGQSQLVKHIANKQATPILLSMNYEQENANNKAVQLLNMQRQQLHSQSSSSDGGCNKSSSSAVDSVPSSVASSPQATTGQQPQPAPKSSKTTDSTASSSTTSGYYAGSNSTGSASVDSDSQGTVDGHQPLKHQATASGNAVGASVKQVTIKANYHQPYSNNASEWQQQQQEEGSRAKIALGSYGAARVPTGNRLLIGNKAQFKSSQSVDTVQRSQRGSQKQQFYLGEANNNDEDDCGHQGGNQAVAGHLQADGQQQTGWSPMNQIQHTNAPSSLKYVSFDV